MDAQQFLAEFGHIASAPEGVQKLREMILSLAVSGDLVFEPPKDAGLLLESINRRKSEHPEQKKVVPSQPKLDRKEVKTPPHWAICRLGDLVLTITGGGTPSKGNPAYWGGDIPWASVKDLKDNKYLTETIDHISEEGLRKSASNLIPPGRIIVCTRMGLGKLAINKISIAINQDLKALELPKEVNIDYFYILYRTRNIEGKGTTVSGIKQDQLLSLPAALPPIEEQARIVAKVDELMALCDDMEAQQQERTALCIKARRTTLSELVGSKSPTELQKSWNRTQANLSLLIDNPDAVEEIKAAIRELTVRGFFAETTDDSVDSFLANIQRKKTGKRFARLTKSPGEFTLPNGWQWVLLEDLLAGSDSGWSPKCDPEPRNGDDWGVLKVSAVTWGSFLSHENKKLPRSLNARPQFEVKPGDFLLSRANTAELVARSVIVPSDCPPHLMMSDKIVRLEFVDDQVKPWVNLVNNSAWARHYYKANATGTSDSMRNVSRQIIHELAIPLPPLSLQSKLLEKLKSLESLCEQLRNQFASALRTAQMLALAAVATITGIRTEEEEELKAPKTELISKLRIGVHPTVREQAPLAAILARHNGEMPAKDLWQRYGGDIDAFYQQLKREVGKGWIAEPEVAEMRSVEAP